MQLAAWLRNRGVVKPSLGASATYVRKTYQRPCAGRGASWWIFTRWGGLPQRTTARRER